MSEAVPKAIKLARISRDAVIGVGTNFTSCTVLPTDAAGVPLCQKPEFQREPNAWVKLWKHHAAQPQADKVNAVAVKRNEPFLAPGRQSLVGVARAQSLADGRGGAAGVWGRRALHRGRRLDRVADDGDRTAERLRRRVQGLLA